MKRVSIMNAIKGKWTKEFSSPVFMLPPTKHFAILEPRVLRSTSFKRLRNVDGLRLWNCKMSGRILQRKEIEKAKKALLLPTGDWRILCSSEASFDGFWSYRFAKGSVGLLVLNFNYPKQPFDGQSSFFFFLFAPSPELKNCFIFSIPWPLPSIIYSQKRRGGLV